MDTVYANQSDAINAAATRADLNGSPVAVVFSPSTRFYRCVEDAELYEDLCDMGAVEPVAVIDPETAGMA